VRDSASANNNIGWRLIGSSNNLVMGKLYVGANLEVDCVVIGGTDPGLDSSCDGGITQTVTNITLANAWVGKLSSGDVVNSSDENGLASHPGVSVEDFDWSGFENRYRGWGINGSVFPGSDNAAKWTTDQGVIWDWSLSTQGDGDNGEPALLGVLPVPENRNVETVIWAASGLTKDDIGCEQARTGSIWYSFIEKCGSSALQWAVEIMGDGIGNENNLCEAGETCLHTPNIGAYQGHGELVDHAIIPAGGNLTGDVVLKKYEFNGR